MVDCVTNAGPILLSRRPFLWRSDPKGEDNVCATVDTPKSKRMKGSQLGREIPGPRCIKLLSMFVFDAPRGQEENKVRNKVDSFKVNSDNYYLDQWEYSSHQS